MSATDTWIAFLDEYEAYLTDIAISLESGKVTTRIFDQQQPSTPLPKTLRERAVFLGERSDTLATTMQTRMDTITTVLRYSRMKDPERVILIDVLA